MTASDTASSEALNVRIRRELVEAIIERIEANGWTQAEAAHRLRVSQPRISHLVGRHTERFSVDALLNMAVAVGLQVHIDIAVPNP